MTECAFARRPFQIVRFKGFRFSPLAGFPVALLLATTVTELFGATPSLPVQNGEQLTYRVSWAIVRGAGEIKIAAGIDPVTPGRITVATTTATRRLARLLMPFDARGESVYDIGTGLLSSIHETQKAGDKEKEYTVTFDHVGRQASYVNRDSKEPTLIALPRGDPADIIMALLRTRTWDLKPGESRDSLVVVEGRDIYELTIHALGYEDISTPLGTFKTVMLEPRMEKTPPKGMFRRGSTVKVWIAQNEQRLPVRFAVEFKIGTGIATLEAYTPPAAKTAGEISPPVEAGGGRR